MARAEEAKLRSLSSRNTAAAKIGPPMARAEEAKLRSLSSGKNS